MASMAKSSERTNFFTKWIRCCQVTVAVVRFLCACCVGCGNLRNFLSSTRHQTPNSIVFGSAAQRPPPRRMIVNAFVFQFVNYKRIRSGARTIENGYLSIFPFCRVFIEMAEHGPSGRTRKVNQSLVDGRHINVDTHRVAAADTTFKWH